MNPGFALVVGAEDAAVLGGDLALDRFAGLVGDLAFLQVGGLAGDRGGRQLGLDDGEDNIRVLAIDREAAAAQGTFGQTLDHLLPAFAAVAGLDQAPAWAEFNARIASA